MPRFFCDYCDAYLTHDSAPGRQQHIRGWKHRENFKAYYQQFLPQWEAERMAREYQQFPHSGQYHGSYGNVAPHMPPANTGAHVGMVGAIPAPLAGMPTFRPPPAFQPPPAFPQSITHAPSQSSGASVMMGFTSSVLSAVDTVSTSGQIGAAEGTSVEE